MSRHAEDDLVGEYMRVINHKDSEILDLMAKVERLDLESKKAEDRYRTKVLSLKSSLRELQISVQDTDRSKADNNRELSTLRDERDRLAADVSTLRAALLRHEDHLKGVLKTSAKAHKHEAVARDRVEYEMRELKRAYDEKAQSALDRIGALEVQLASAQRRVSEVTEDAHRWRLEAKKWKEALAERETESTETRLRMRELVPREQVSAELKQTEERYRATIEKLEKDAKRLRDELLLESSAGARKDTGVMQLKGELQRAEQELVSMRRAAQDLELQLAQDRLLNAQRLDEVKLEAETKVGEFRDELNRVANERQRMEGEVAILRQRLSESEERQGATARSWSDAERAYEQEIHDLKVLASDRRREAETSGRLAQQLQSALQSSTDQVDTKVAKLQKDVMKYRDDMEIAQAAASRNAELLIQKEASISDLRREVQRLAAGEADLKKRIIDSESALQTALSEHRAANAAHADEVRELRVSEHKSRQESQREVVQLQTRLNSLEAECSRLQSHMQVAEEKERQFVKAQREADTELTKLQVFAAEKEAILTTLRRSGESATASLTSCQGQLETTRRSLAEATQENDRLVTDLARVKAMLQAREMELIEVQRNMQRLEEQSREQIGHGENEISSLQHRLRAVSGQIAEAEHRLSLETAEKLRLDAAKSEEIQRLHRDVVAPLHEKVDNLSKMYQRAEASNREKEDRLSVLASVTGDRDELRRQFDSNQHELTRLRSQLTSLQEADREVGRERENGRRQRAEIDGLLAKVAGLEASLDAASRELSDLHTREVTLVTQVSNKHAELSAVSERYANADSLRKIAEKQVSELQQREQELLLRLEETKSAYNVLQACFDKQQEQLDTSRRQRELEYLSRTR